MNETIKNLLLRLPGLSEIHRKSKDIEKREGELALRQAEFELLKRKFNTLVSGVLEFHERGPDSIDRMPWRHPFLSASNIRRFREYSEAVWQLALAYGRAHPASPTCAFAVNMAQNMYKWARLAQQYGAQTALFPNVMEGSALNCPEWEDFDGEWPDLMDGEGFRKAHPEIVPDVPCHRVPLNGSELYAAYQRFYEGKRAPLLRLLAASPGLRHEVLLTYTSCYPFYQLAKALSEFDVVYAASAPFAAYASGRPYCVFSVGGDLQEDCGRGDDLGRTMHLSFNAARFLMVSNPHALGHSRRLGLTNGVYLPYPMDDDRYCPGEGLARREWEAAYGKGVYVLTTMRLDTRVKGLGGGLFEALVGAAKIRPDLRFVFMAWGEDLPAVKDLVASGGMRDRFIMLNPVGKKRLIDYYRSCDVVLDQLVYGYYGATALEAAAIGKPVIMKLRAEQYAALYAGDVAPVMNVDSHAQLVEALLALAGSGDLRRERGERMRAWLVRNHGEKKTVPLLLGLLRLAADRVPLPAGLVNPLCDQPTGEEQDYHAACLRHDTRLQDGGTDA